MRLIVEERFVFYFWINKVHFFKAELQDVIVRDFMNIGWNWEKLIFNYLAVSSHFVWPLWLIPMASKKMVLSHFFDLVNHELYTLNHEIFLSSFVCYVSD